MAKVLLAEDDKDLHNILRTFLLFEHHTVESAYSGEEAETLLSVSDFDLLVLDWNLPGISGIDVLTNFRSSGAQEPVLMITGKTAVDDKLRGLDTGADDYLTKPFNIQEFGARIRALLRRSSNNKLNMKGNVLSVADLSLDVIRYRLEKNGVPVPLLPKEFQLLEFLMRHPNHVYSADALMDKVWSSDSEVTHEALRSTIKRIRRKIDPEGTLLRTVHGVGYVLQTE